MPSLRHTVTLESVPRRWLEEAIVSAHELLTELRSENGVLHLEDEPVPGVRHIAGRHLAPGARYEVTEDDGSAGDGAAGEDGARDPVEAGAQRLEVEVAEWSRTGTTRLRLTGGGPSSVAYGEVTLRSAHVPASLTLEGGFRGDGPFARYRRGTLEVGFDLTRWWAADGRSPAPLTVGIRHPLLRALVRVTVERARNGRWKVGVLTTFRGCGWARPLVAVACLFARARVRAQYRTGLDGPAERWNKEAPSVVAHSPRRLRAEVIAELRTRDAR